MTAEPPSGPQAPPGPSTTAPSAAAPRGPLAVPAFRWFVISLAAATMGSQIQGAVVAYQLYAMTGDPLSLGLIGLAEAIPFIGCALVAGHVADVLDRRRLAVAALVVTAVCALLLWIVTHQQARLGSEVTRIAIYGVIAASGVARSFLQPARFGLSAEILPASLYARAVNWRTGTWQLAAVMGPAVGGVLYAALGADAAYAATVALLGLAAFAMMRISRPPRVRRPPASALDSLREGFTFLWHEPVLLWALVLDLFAVLFGGAAALLPVFAADVLHVGPHGFGALRAAPAFGAVVTSLWLAVRPPPRRSGAVMLASVALFGVFTIAFALSRTFWLSLLLLAATGAADMVSVVIRGTLLQLRVPEHMLGRLGAINQIFIGSSNEIGAFESGVAARLLGTVPSVVFGGAMTLVVVAVTTWRAPSLRRLRGMGAP